MAKRVGGRGKRKKRLKLHLAEALGIEDESTKVLYAFSLYISSKQEITKKMKDPKWLSAAVYDFRKLFGINFLDYTLDPVEAIMLIRNLEASTDSKIGALANGLTTTFDFHTMLTGELFRSFVYANSKSKKKMELPWDQKKETKKASSKVISKKRADRIFANLKQTERTMSPPDKDILI